MRASLLGIPAAAAAALAFSLAGATAAPIAPASGAGVQGAKVETVQWRHGHRGWHGGHRGGWRGGRGWHGHRGGWHRGGAGVAAGIAGLAAGALIGSAIANQPGAVYEDEPVYGGNAAAYCAQRFKSWDPATGTYLGYDGYRHPCP